MSDSTAIENETRAWRDFLDEFQFAPLYILLLLDRLKSSFVLACAQTPVDGAREALDEIRRAAHNVRFDRRPPRSLDRDDRQIYEPVTKRAAREMQVAADLLSDVFGRYASGDYDLTRTADDLLREACALSLADDDLSAAQRMNEAGVLAFRGSPMWRGWQDEGSPAFREHAFLLFAILDISGNILPLAAIDEQRHKADELARQLTPKAAPAKIEPRAENQQSDQSSMEAIERLVQLAQRDAPMTDEEIQAAGVERDRQIALATEVLYGAGPAPDEIVVHVRAVMVRALGMLRHDDQDFIEHLISLIVDEEDEDEEESELLETVVEALQHIGAPAAHACLRFMRNSFHTEARFEVARALGAAGRGSPEVFDYLLSQFEQEDPETGKARWALSLALLHDARAITPLAHALEVTRDEEDDIVREYEAFDYLDALHELGAIVAFIHPPPDQEYEQGWTAVDIRGMGLLADVAPVDWLPPAERDEIVDAELDGWDEYEDDDSDDDDDDDDDDEDDAPLPFARDDWPSISYTSPASMRPYVNETKVGRNDPCPCGSGKKYKHCHGKTA